MDSTLIKILQESSNNPTYQTLADYLISRRAYPELRFQNMPGKYGTFTSPGLFSNNSIPDRGVLSLNEAAKQWDPKAMAPTMTHELTHAAEKQMIKQYYEIKNKTNKTDLEKQFINNFQKIIGSSESEINKWMKKVVPGFVKDEGDYRATGREGLAFGVGNSAFEKTESDRPAPAHVDPTIYTVFNLLLDQAKRVQDEQKQYQGR